ncbi:MAG: twin-arginine translocase subunit TatC [Anaerolineales bacterium]|nr:twin-arginine translocase subunit TatC [Anaerolineales bacterium]
MSALTRVFAAPWRVLKTLWLGLWRLLTAPLRWVKGLWDAVYKFFTEMPEDAPLSETVAESFQSRESFFDTLAAFGEHIEALRRHLFRSLIVLALMAGVAFWQITAIMAFLAAPLAEGALQVYLEIPTRSIAENFNRLLEIGTASIRILTTREPAEGIGVVMRVSLLAATVLAMPWIVTEAYLFVAPGLYPRTRIRLLFAIPLASLLFVTGVAFTYFIMLPVAVPFLEEFGGFSTAWTPSSYFNMVTGVMFWVGVAFQMPLIIYALASIGLLRTKQLVAQWRIAVVIIAVIAATITPTTDPINMFIVMLPMVGLYFVSIAGAWFAERGLRRRRERDEATA